MNVNLIKGATQADLTKSVNNSKTYRDEAQAFSIVSEDKSIESAYSALNASISSTTASDKATIATTKANEASNSANSATTQAGIATTKASEASASATSANNSATTATTKASEANASAISASNSATSASNSATTATTKANEASASATTAITQADIATTKANAASLSAISAANSASSALASELAATAVVTEPLKRAIGNINNPLLDMPLKNSLAMKAGVGSTTFTRASTATYIDRYRVLKTAGVDAPRFENDGLLIEENSTNLLTYSDNMLNGYAAKRATLTLSTTELSPDCITYASEFRENTETGSSYLYKSTTFTAGTTYTYSLFAKSINGQNLRLAPFNSGIGFDKNYLVDFDLTAGTISGSDASNAKIVPLANGWYRCSLTATCTTTATGNALLLSTGTNYESPDYGLYIFGAQLEEQPFASSYIPTTGSAVTRAVADTSITAYGNVPSKDEGTIYCRFKLLSSHNSYNFIWGLYYAPTNFLRCTVSINGFLNVQSGSSSGGLSTGSTPFALNKNQESSVCATWKDNLMNVYIDGVLAYQQSWSGDLFNTDLPTLANFSIGKYSPTYTTLIGNGNYKSFKTYDKALTPTEISLLG